VDNVDDEIVGLAGVRVPIHVSSYNMKVRYFPHLRLLRNRSMRERRLCSVLEVVAVCVCVQVSSVCIQLHRHTDIHTYTYTHIHIYTY
jgi:hypothetical protein